MRLGKTITWALAACLAAAAAAAAPASPPPPGPSPPFSILGTRDGLPNASVSGIAQDSQGFLWFGTQGGLARYDGYSFKLFGHVPFDGASLPHDLVQTIYLDGETLWAGTYGGLARLDLQTERFTTYANDPDRVDSLSNDVVTCVARDARGQLWVGTLDGLNLLDEATGSFKRFRHSKDDPSSLPADVVRALEADREGRLWVGTSGGGLALFDYATQGFRAYRKGDPARDGSILSDFIMDIDEDSSGRLWIATWYGGLSLFDPASGRFENHPTADERAYSLCAAEDGVVYVGTWGGGLFAYDIASGSFSRRRASPSPGSLSNDVVYSMLRDAAGELWVGTNGGGVNRLGWAGRGFESIAAGPEGMPAGKVYSVLIDRLGYLWVGVYNEGIARRDPATGAWRRYRRSPGDPRSLPNDIVNFLLEDSSGAVWAGTNDGLARYDRASDSFSVTKPVPGSPASISSEIMYAMIEDPSGGAWIGTFRSGLEHWADRRSSASGFRHFAHDGADPSSIADNLVTALAYDGEGRLWVGTNKGLDRLQGSEGEAPGPSRGASFVHYRYDPSKKVGVSSDSIRTMFLDSRKVLWIGSAGGGLMRYEPETDSFVSYTKRDGLPSNTVLRVLEDASSNLWVSTQAGLAVYDRASGRFRGLSVYSELRSAEFFSGAFRAADGSLYFGALDRLYKFDPGSYAFNDHRPPVAISSISAKGMPAIGAAAAARLKRLELPWTGNSVSFEFAALDYRDPERNRYSFRLEGFDGEWSPVGPGHSATYTNLPGGGYLFRVRASNNDGLWNEEGVALPVRVGFAPWSGPWAILLYALILAGGGYALAHFSSRASLRAAREETDILIAKLIETSASIENAANIDALTGLPNRPKLRESLDRAFERAVGLKRELAVVMVDIDHFKAYNDRYGRAAGDECLRRVAEALSLCVRRSTDLVGRYGGEEFLFILGETGLEGALAEGETARKAVEGLGMRRSDFRPGPVVTVSVGCAAVQPEEGNSPSLLVESAEKALMAAKQRGRNRTSD
jgi:diguanylate cyclase (GGDEF)-like protein